MNGDTVNGDTVDGDTVDGDTVDGDTVEDPAATLTQWQIRGKALVARAVVVVFAAANLIAAVLDWHSGGTGLDVVRLGCWATATAVAVLAIIVAVRTRVRLRPDGIEIRQVRTRTLLWADVIDVRLEQRNQQTIWVESGDGDHRALPAPTRWRPPPSDTTMLDAVTAIEYRRLLAR